MIKWNSDTCKCVIEFDKNSFLITKIINECGVHSHTVGESFIGCQSQGHNVTENIKFNVDSNYIKKEAISLI